MLVPVVDLTKFGVIRDVEDYLLPPEAWTDGRNMRLRDGKVTRMGGSLAVLDPPSVPPYWLLHAIDSANASHWLYAGLTQVWEYSAGVHTNISRSGSAYAATEDGLWNGGILNGIPVINNGVDVPQSWPTISAGVDLVDLPNWPATDRCAVLRPFKNYLFALDMTVSGTRFPHRLKVSHPAAPGAVPSSWDETDPTKQVVSRDIGEDDMPMIDAVPLGSLMILYKGRTTHYAQFIGGTQVWRTDKLFQASGLLSKNCAVAFAEGRKHFLMTGEDVVIHDGQNRVSVIDKRDQKWLLSNMDITNFGRSFSIAYHEEEECWFCFPMMGSVWPNMALVWSALDGSVTFRDLDQASFIGLGQIPLNTSDPWDADGASWDSDVSVWDTFAHPPFVRRLLQAKPTGTKLLHLESTDQFNGVDYTAFVERTGLDLIGVSDSGQVMRDQRSKRLIRGVWLRARGAPIHVQIATQQEIAGPLTWGPAQVFTPGVDAKLDFADETRLFGIRFSALTAGATELMSYSVDVEPLGGF